MNFDPAFLTFVEALKGSDAAGAALHVNRSQAANGRIGIVLGLNAGQTFAAGRYTITWDGRNERGVRVPSGVYLYAMTAGEFKATRKMAILK
jgi:hypothetical protein